MGHKTIFAFTTRLFVVLLLLFLLMQQHVMLAHAANVAQLKSQQQHQPPQQQQQQATLGQVTSAQQHHGPAQLQPHQHHQQSAAPHPGSNTNAGHHLGAHSLSASSSSSPSSSSSSSSTMPAAHFVNDKDATAAAVQEVLKHFNADDDLTDPYQLLNELKREASAASGLATPPAPPSPPLSGIASNYPWNLFERTPYGSASYNTMPLPPMPAIAGLFPHLFSPYEGYPSSFPVTPRFMPFMSYPQPILVPYPFYMTPEMFYPGFSPIANEFEDSMSRGAAASSRRPSPLQHTTSGYSRNSPIYYVRLPPTPYMFLPSLGLGATASAMSGFPAMMPYQSLPSFPSFSSIFNVPINFLANGKPNNIYQMGGSPNDLQSPLQFANIPANFQSRPPPPPPPPHHSASNVGGGYRPTSSTHNYLHSPPIASSSNNNYGSSYPSATGSSGSSSSASSSPPQTVQDSKLTSLKRPYFFNGRPEDIYILPNNFNSLYTAENSYY